MKKILLSTAFVALLAVGSSCKGKEKDKATDTTTTTTPSVGKEVTPPPAAPVEIAGDEALRQGVTDATKDIKGLTTRVENGVIYLSGSITRDDNMRISPTLSSLNPKKIDRTNLTVQQ